jgi:alpha-ribazole phosphatase
MSAPTHWWWVRHARVPGAPARLFGQLDVSCDTSDITSFRALAAILPEDAVWIVSSLARTRETMEAIAAAGTPLPEPVVEPDLREQNFGLWQGLSWTEMEADDPDTYAAFWRDPVRAAPPEGESYAALMGRARAAIQRLTAHYAGRTVVCVSHGGTIRAAIATALGLDADAALALVVDNLSVTRLSYVEDKLLRGAGAVWLVQGVNCPCRWIIPGPPC